jgi:hypothetical protein
MGSVRHRKVPFQGLYSLPVVVLRMVPDWPAAHPVLVSTKETPERKLVVPLGWGVQVAPPPVVSRMEPRPFFW